MDAKAQAGWAIFTRSGNLFIADIRSTKRDAIASFLVGTDRTWKYFSARGFCCIRVMITPAVKA